MACRIWDLIESELNLFDKMLIGKDIAVLSALDKSLIGRRGIVLDETKNTLVIGSALGERIRVSKSIISMSIRDGPREAVVQGKAVLGTPVERIRG